MLHAIECIAKVGHSNNAVQSKSQGRCNITALQLLSFFLVLYCSPQF